MQSKRCDPVKTGTCHRLLFSKAGIKKHSFVGVTVHCSVQVVFLK